MKVQKAVSFDVDVLDLLMKECKREMISLSDYVMEALNNLGPLDYEMAQRVRSKTGMGIRRDEFLAARATKVEVESDRPANKNDAPYPRETY
jgi:hypothetical protein